MTLLVWITIGFIKFDIIQKYFPVSNFVKSWILLLVTSPMNYVNSLFMNYMNYVKYMN